MKQISLYILFVFFCFSCREPENPPTFSTVATANAWKSGYARDNGNVFTSLYNGWRFTFNIDGTLLVTGGGMNMNGTWKENVPARQVEIFINSSALPAVFVSRVWDISFLTPTRIKLADNRFSPTQEFYLDKP
jgi:hypothetical protein